MKKIILWVLLLSSILLQAQDPQITAGYRQDNLYTNIPINIYTINTSGDEEDWIGIYPKGASNDWANVVSWTFLKAPHRHHNKLRVTAAGEYEARLFFHNSFNLEASDSFTVQESPLNPTTVKTNKDTYNENEKIQVKLKDMLGHPQDWVAIYPKGSNNDWGNIIDWSWTKGKVDTSITFNGLNAGAYDVRAFYKNSFNVEASHSFIVKNAQQKPARIYMHNYLTTNQNIRVEFRNFSGDEQDWIAIYKKGTSNDWGNVIAWKWTNGAMEGHLTFPKLPEGDYEVRGFFDNSYDLEVKHSFFVKKNPINHNNLIEKAKEHCQNNNNNTSQVLCSNEDHIVYILEELSEGENFYTGHYRISIEEENEYVKVISENFLPVWEQPRVSKYFISHKLENTPLYALYSTSNEADERGAFLFYYKDASVLVFPYFERQGFLKTIKTFDNGSKLIIKYTHDIDAVVNTTEIYNISNPKSPKLISKVEN
jgi:hypothetical protein